jgi:hypothetical protein
MDSIGCVIEEIHPLNGNNLQHKLKNLFCQRFVGCDMDHVEILELLRKILKKVSHDDASSS